MPNTAAETTILVVPRFDGREGGKAVGTTLHLDGAIDAEQRHGEIGAGVAGARALLGYAVICNECIARCVDIVREQDERKVAEAGREMTVTGKAPRGRKAKKAGHVPGVGDVKE
jgi:hypothetical protein